MRVLRALLLLFIPAVAAAHPGGGLIALDANTVIFGDSMYNAVWRIEKGKKPQALMTKFHAHWTTLGLDGHIYSEAFGEMGGALFRVDLGGAKHRKIAEETHLNAPVFAVGKRGELIFQKGDQIVERSANGTVKPFRGSGIIAKGDPPLRQIIAYAWASDGTLYLSDGDRIRRLGVNGVIRNALRFEGKLLEPQIWNSAGAPRVWSIAVVSNKHIYAALPDLGQVIRIDNDGSRHIIDTSTAGWRVTAVATHGDNLFMLASSDRTNDGQRVRVMRAGGKVELFGQIEP